ncbi:MAG TPA: tetratricopeptide repeat protein [Rhodanobacteraceae bacterium]
MKWLWGGIAVYLVFVAGLVVWASGRVDPARVAPVAYSEQPANPTLAPDTQSVGALLASAAAGDADAQYRAGRAYATGRGVPQDARRAAVWYERSARQGHARAQVALGWARHVGAGVPRDDVIAATWMTLAAAHGDARATRRVTLIERGMTPEQLAAVAHAVQRWRAGRHGD